MKLAKINSNSSSLLEKIDNSNKSIKWTNRYDAPPGYSFNDSGWVQTVVPFPKITVSFLPHLVRKLGEENVLIQNLLALRLLNDLNHAVLESALSNRYKQAFLGKDCDEEIWQRVVHVSRSITDKENLPVFDKEILTMDDIWYSRDCSEGSKASIRKLIRQNYIDNVRSLMPINRKYKTNEVMLDADVSKYSVNEYWRKNALDAKNRAMSAISEAIIDLIDRNVRLDQSSIAALAGLSVRSIQRYKDTMIMLNK
jgi:hypothetical protein